MTQTRWFRIPGTLALALSIGMVGCGSNDNSSGTGGTGGSGATGGAGGSGGTGGSGALSCPGGEDTTGCSVALAPGSDDTTAVQTALINSKSGDTVCFCPGSYSFEKELSLTTTNVSVKGLGAKNTDVVLDFKNQTQGKDAFGVTADGFSVENLSLKNSHGNGIVVTGANGRHVQEHQGELGRGLGHRQRRLRHLPRTEHQRASSRTAKSSAPQTRGSTSASARTPSCATTRCTATWPASSSRTPRTAKATATSRGTTRRASWCSRCRTSTRRTRKQTNVHDNNVHDNNRDNFAERRLDRVERAGRDGHSRARRRRGRSPQQHHHEQRVAPASSCSASTRWRSS